VHACFPKHICIINKLSQLPWQQKHKKMKKIISFLSAVLFIATLSAATNETGKPFNNFSAQYFTPFTKIIIEDDIDLALNENTARKIELNGSVADMNKVEWIIKKGVLYIRSKAGSLNHKVLVTLDVANLKTIEINGSSVVKSIGELHSTSLHVHVNGDCFVAIKNSGDIKVTASETADFEIRKRVGNIYTN